ncbi:MAG: hypothetical protein IPM29_00885 [Planctomycetes bacterium]|nr:hypothetical protein [Planctomycetota bacterium]
MTTMRWVIVTMLTAIAVSAQRSTFLMGKGTAAIPGGAQVIQAEAGVPDGNASVGYSTTPVTHFHGEVAHGPGDPGSLIWLRNDAGDPPGTLGVEWIEFTPSSSRTTALVQFAGSDSNDGLADVYVRRNGAYTLVGSLDTRDMGTHWVHIRTAQPFQSVLVSQRGGNPGHDHVSIDFACFPAPPIFFGTACSPGTYSPLVGADGPLYVAPPDPSHAIDLFVTRAWQGQIAVCLLGFPSPVAIPLPLPGCANLLLVNFFGIAVPVSPNGDAAVRVPGNSNPALIGATLSCQYVVMYAPPAFGSTERMDLTFTQ